VQKITTLRVLIAPALILSSACAPRLQDIQQYTLDERIRYVCDNNKQIKEADETRAALQKETQLLENALQHGYFAADCDRRIGLSSPPLSITYAFCNAELTPVNRAAIAHHLKIKREEMLHADNTHLSYWQQCAAFVATLNVAESYDFNWTQNRRWQKPLNEEATRQRRKKLADIAHKYGIGLQVFEKRANHSGLLLEETTQLQGDFFTEYGLNDKTGRILSATLGSYAVAVNEDAPLLQLIVPHPHGKKATAQRRVTQLRKYLQKNLDIGRNIVYTTEMTDDKTPPANTDVIVIREATQ